MNYLDFLKLLLALGPKLPQAAALIQHIVNDVQDLIALLKPAQAFAASESAMELNATEQAAESEVLAALVADGGNETFGAIGDGTLLRLLYQFIKENPELLKFILALLT